MNNPAFQNLTAKCQKIGILIPDGDIFDAYRADIKNLIVRIEKNHFANTTLYCQLLTEIHTIVYNITTAWVGLNPDLIVTEYINRINNPIYAQSYGTGHVVTDNPYEIPHWNIRPAYFEICKPTPCEELAMIIDRRQPKISREITTVFRDWSRVELWSTDAYQKFIN